MTRKERRASSPARPKQVHVHAIVQNLVRFYNPKAKRKAPRRRVFSTRSGFGRRPSHESTDSTAPGSEATDKSGGESHQSSTLSHDPTLTTFAQLGCLLLNCQRSFISLVDEESQYILAEATQSVSLQDPNNCLPGDELYLGARMIPVSWGLCPDTIRVFSAEDSSQNIATDNITANRVCYIVNDLSEDECFSGKPYVTDWPHMRFYAEVPLRTRTGYVIGSYSVVDNQPRNGVQGAALDKLTEIASAIANHLELVQAHARLKRSQAMMKGLGRFVDGKSVREWWKDAFNNEFKHLEELKRYSEERPSGFANTVSESSEQIETESTVSDAPETVSVGALAEEEVDELSSTAATATFTSRTQTTEDLTELNRNLSLQQEAMKFLRSGSIHDPDHRPSFKGDASSQESLAYAATKQLFSRASHLITESSSLDGILFVDASLQDIAVTKGKRTPNTGSGPSPRFAGFPNIDTASHAIDAPHGHPLEQEIIDDEMSRFHMANESSSKNDVLLSPSKRRTLNCELLGYCCSGGTQYDILPSSQQMSLPQSTLRGLLRKYPHGRIFHFDEDGSLLPSKEEMTTRRNIQGSPGQLASKLYKFEREKEQLRAYQLLDICPSARAVIFFPLWDPQKDQWFAGSLAWTKDPARLLQSEDVAYLAAFGSCIMAEKSKMDALTADRAKTDFISSVSHELRSPLHGMLATMEALEETVNSAEQKEMIRTVSTCGEVLLDTLDHILDYAKLSSSRKIKRLRLGEDPRCGTLHYAGRVSNFDLSNLVESVVEGIFAGHNYRGAIGANDHAQKDGLPRTTQLTPLSLNPNVMVILKIDSRASWIFESQIGAWKRIITNLFGNALKYTENGFVQISLRAVSIDSTSKDISRSVAILEIEDSGIGMSQDFLRHSLYTPFAQANPNSVGTGLGLSIVRQLVNDLDGAIEFESEIGYGTTVKISASLNPAASEVPDIQAVGHLAIIRDIAVWCKGLTLCLIGFDYYPEIEETPTGILSVHARKMLAVRSSITTFAADWFGLEIVAAPSLQEARGDILIGVQSQLDISDKTKKIQPLIVFEDVHGGIRTCNGGGIFHLSQPVGPHKLARVLGLCLEHRCSMADLSPTPISPLSPPISVQASRSSSYGFPRPSDDVFSDVSSSFGRNLFATDAPSSARSTSGLEAAVSTHLTVPETKHGQNIIRTTTRDTVLIVEDNPVNMKILVNHMKRAREEYAAAVNGLEALHKYQEYHKTIKIIFMDIAMPVKDGISATRDIRQFELENSLPRVRIVALTCFSSEERQREAFLAGVDKYLVKPVPMKALKPILALDPCNVVPPEHL